MRREDQRGIRHAVHQPGNGGPHDLGAFFSAIVEDVAAALVEYGEVYMQPAAGLVGIGLGHEGCEGAVAARDIADDLLEEQRVFRRLQCVRLMHQIEFELSLSAFGNGCLDLDAGRGSASTEVVYERAGVAQLFERIDVVETGRRAAGIRPGRGNAVAGRVDEIEFDLGCNDRRQSRRPVTFQNQLQQMPAIGVIGSPLSLRIDMGSTGASIPRSIRPAPGHLTDAIEIAALHGQLRSRRVRAPDVDTDGGHGHPDAVLLQLAELFRRDTLAAENAVHVCDGSIEVSGFGGVRLQV